MGTELEEGGGEGRELYDQNASVEGRVKGCYVFTSWLIGAFDLDDCCEQGDK